MKKLSLLALALALAVPAAAQYRQGMGSFGLSASFATSDYYDTQDQYTAFSVSPTLGYSLTDNWMVGTGATYGVLNDGDVHLFGIAPFLRYNAPIAERVGVYGRLSPSFSYYNGPADNDFRVLEAQAGVGGYVFISQKFSVEAFLGGLTFSQTKIMDEESFYGEDVTEHRFEAGFDMSALAFSLLYHF
jgi:hypothetical protein